MIRTSSIDPKCGYCSPCFELTDLEATVAFPNIDPEERIWKLSYTLCLKEVKCINRLFTTRVNLSPKRGDYTGRGFPFELKDDKICVTSPELSVISPKLCCSIPPAPSPVFGEGKPIEFFERDCCFQLNKAIRDVQGTRICKKGHFNFEVKSGVGGPTMSEVKFEAEETIPLIVDRQWNHFINTFGHPGGDALSELYNSDVWSRCLDCPDGCA